MKTLLTCTFVLLLLIQNNAQNTMKQTFIPFSIDIDPMEKLLLINFENDPDELYIGFEPQVFDDTINGNGHLIIAWRKDGKVDVYHQPSLKLNPAKYNIAGKGLENMIETTMETAYFEVKEQGVYCKYEFTDILNRSIFISIEENHSSKRKPFGLLAPMGHAASNPSAMPLVLLHDFYFVRQKNTDYKVSIADNDKKIDTMPMSMDGTKMFFARYSPKPLIATLNQAQDGRLTPLQIPESTNEHTADEYLYTFEWTDENPHIKSIHRNNHIHPVCLSFSPAFPDLLSVPNNSLLQGRFELKAHPSTGKIKGIYTIENKNNEIKIVMTPSKGWKPKYEKFSLRIIYNVGKVFKNWPKTYQWTATIRETPEGMMMKSSWKRI
jgi:hypothetical protein